MIQATTTTTDSALAPQAGEILPNPIDRAIAAAIRQLQSLQAPKIKHGSPTKGYGQKLAKILVDVAAAVDPVILEVGREARFSFGHSVVLDGMFVDVVRCAVEGNATFEICDAAEAFVAEHSECQPYVDAPRLSI